MRWNKADVKGARQKSSKNCGLSLKISALAALRFPSRYCRQTLPTRTVVYGDCKERVCDALNQSHSLGVYVPPGFMSKSRGSLATPPGSECTCSGGVCKPAEL
jgi:hypothetical protein